MIKENDMFLNVLANQDFNVLDFQAVGLNGSNTTLRSEDEYKQSEKITSRAEFQTDGKFDENKFHEWYVGVAQMYNQLSSTDYDKAIMDMASYDMDNIWVDSHKRTKDNRPKLVSVTNENLVTSSLDALGKKGKQTLSQREIAQTQKVYNYETGEWEDSPNDSWFGHFGDTLVLATYDEDEYDENGNLIHQKGQRKLNDEGLPYYETLGGRSVYGKQVLNKLDTLTTDGSSLNRFDFFDSDDIEQKSFVGTLVRNAALVGSMFIGGPVGPIVRGLSVATQAAGLLATIGKIGVGNENKLLNNVQGWSKSVSRHSQTDYAAQNTWCMENFLNMIGDTVGQLAEQRFLFQYVPAMIKGTGREGWKIMAGGNKGQTEIIKKKAGEYAASSKKISDYLGKNSVSLTELNEFKAAMSATAQKYGQKYVDDIINSHQKLGEIISKAYMTGITVQDTYGEAREAGASHMEAALLTLGYASAELALLNSDVGNWIYPELKGQRFRDVAVYEALTKTRQKVAPAIAAGGEAGKEAKRSFVQGLIDLGKDLFNGNTARRAMESGTSKGLKVIASHALGESLEETSEELLADFSKSIFNTVRWLRGEEQLELGEWENMADRYGMSALGGFFGGGITSAATDFSVAKKLSNMNQTEAMQELLYIVNNGKEQEFFDNIKNIQIRDKNLSAFDPIEVNGETVAWAEAKAGEDQDTVAKKLIRKQVNTLKEILVSERAKISTDSLLNKLAGADSKEIISDVLFGKLRESRALKLFAQDFQLMQDDLVRAKADLIAAETKTTDSAEASTLQEDLIKQAEERLKFARERISRYLDGNIVPQAIRNAAFEINSSLHGGFDLHLDLKSYALYKTGIEYDKLSEKEQKEVEEAHQQYLNTQASDDINIAAQAFQNLIETSTPLIQQYGEFLQKLKQDSPELIRPLEFTAGIIQNLSISKEDVKKALGVEEIDQEGYINFLNEQLKQQQIYNPEAFGLLSPEIVRQSQEIQLNYTDGDESSKLQAQDHAKIFLNDKMFDNIDAFIQPLLEQEYIHPEVKNALIKTLTRMLNDNNAIGQLVSTGEMSHPEMVGLSGPEAIARKMALAATYNQRGNVLRVLRKQVREKNNTPVLEMLDAFKKASINSEIAITQHLKETEEAIDTSLDSLDDFAQQEDWEKANDEALRIINSFIAVIEGVKMDNGDFNNPTSYTTLINSISRKHGIPDYVELAELDSETANLIIQDAKIIRDKLIFARNLSDSNKGQKLQQQDRVAARKNIILFKNYARLINAIPDDWISDEEGVSAKQKLQLVLESLTNLKQFTDNDVIKLNKEQRYLAAKEIQTFEDAIYDIFQANKQSDGQPNKAKLKQLLNNLGKNGGFFQRTGDLLLEDSKDIDMNSFIWYVAVRSSIKTSDYLTTYKEGLSPTIAAIPSQELATQMGVAAMFNMGVLNSWVEVYHETVCENFENADVDERKRLLKLWANGQDIYAEELSKYFGSYDLLPQFKNMVFIEGGPGTGKSGGCFVSVINTAEQVDKDVRGKILFAHTNDTTAKEAAGKLNIKNYKGREALLTWISSEWRDTSKNIREVTVDGKIEKRRYLYEDSYTYDEQGRLVNRWKLNKYSEAELPKYIFIDEVSHYNQQELSMIEQFARENGIVVITAGDLDQDTQVVYAKNPAGGDEDVTVTINRNFFIRSPKLGVSLRTRNKQMSQATATTQAAISTLRKGENIPGLNYTYLDNHPEHKGLYGVKTSDAKNGLTDKVKQTIQTMIDTLKPGQKIGYIHNGDESELYKYLTENFKDKIDLFEGDQAQGLEGQYYIVEMDEHLPKSAYLRRLYTGITRAEQGVLALTHDNKVGTIDSKEDKNFFEENLSETAVRNSAKNRENEIIRQLEDVDAKPLEFNYVQKETLKIDEMSKDEDEDVELPVVPEPEIVPDMIGDSYTSEETAQQEVDALLNKIGKDLSEVEAVDISDPNDPKKYDIEEIYVKKETINGTTVWTPTIKLKVDEGFAENSIAKFNKDFEIIDKQTNEIIPTYNVGDRIIIEKDGVTSNVTIESFKVENGSVIYTVKDLSNDESKDIEQTDLQSMFKGFYTEVIEEPEKTDTGIIDTGMNNYTDEEFAAVVSKLNDDDIEYDLTGEHLSHFLYTHNIHETSGTADEDGNFIIPGDSTRSKNRIDNGIGLYRIKAQQNEELKYTDIEKLLGKIRSVMFHKPKNEIASFLENELGLTELTVDWAFKVHSEYAEDGRDPKFSRFDITEDESLSYVHADTDSLDSAKKPMRRKLMLRVKDASGKYILEISAASLNSPVTLLKLRDKSGKPVFADFLTVFNNNLVVNDDASIYRAVKAVIDTDYGRPLTDIEQDLIELCKFWIFTGDGIFPLSKQFELCKQNVSGPMFIRKKGSNQINEDLQSTNNVITLEEYAANAAITMSSVMQSKDGKIGDIYDDKLYPGMSFVLVSDDVSLDTDEKLVSQYEAQVRAKHNGEPFENKVRLKYIVAPKVGVKEWLHNQRALYKKSMGVNSVDIYDIGDTFTVFRILQAIYKANPDLTILDSSFRNENIIESYITTLNEIEENWNSDEIQFSSSEQENKYNELKSKIGERQARRKMKIQEQYNFLTSKVTEKVRTNFSRAESANTTVHDRMIQFLTQSIWKRQAGSTEETTNLDMIDTIAKLSKQGGFEDVRFQIRYSWNEDANIGSFIKIDSPNKHSLGYIKIGGETIDTSFKINSRVDTSMFSSDVMFAEIKKFNEHWEYKDGAYRLKQQWYLNDMLPYLGRKKKKTSANTATETSSTETVVKTIGDVVKNKYSRYASVLNSNILLSEDYNTETEMLIALANDFSKTPGQFGIVYNGKLYLSKFDSDIELPSDFQSNISNIPNDGIGINVIYKGVEIRANLLPLVNDGNISGFELQLYRQVSLNPENADITEIIPSLDNLKTINETITNDPFGFKPVELFPQDVNISGIDYWNHLNEMFEAIAEDYTIPYDVDAQNDIRDYYNSQIDNLSIDDSDKVIIRKVIDKLLAGKFNESLLEVGDTVIYNNEYYTVKDPTQIFLESQSDTNEKIQVEDITELRKEIIDCNPIKLELL